MSVEFYHSMRERKKIIKRLAAAGETLLHDDHLTDGRKRLTFEIEIPKDDPDFILYKLLLVKLENNTITIEQLKTLIRLEHGFKLTQTTRDKILIAVQGIIGTLRDRLKSAFRL